MTTISRGASALLLAAVVSSARAQTYRAAPVETGSGVRALPAAAAGAVGSLSASPAVLSVSPSLAPSPSVSAALAPAAVPQAAATAVAAPAALAAPAAAAAPSAAAVSAAAESPAATINLSATVSSPRSAASVSGPAKTLPSPAAGGARTSVDSLAGLSAFEQGALIDGGSSRGEPGPVSGVALKASRPAPLKRAIAGVSAFGASILAAAASPVAAAASSAPAAPAHGWSLLSVAAAIAVVALVGAGGYAGVRAFNLALSTRAGRYALTIGLPVATFGATYLIFSRLVSHAAAAAAPVAQAAAPVVKAVMYRGHLVVPAAPGADGTGLDYFSIMYLFIGIQILSGWLMHRVINPENAPFVKFGQFIGMLMAGLWLTGLSIGVVHSLAAIGAVWSYATVAAIFGAIALAVVKSRFWIDIRKIQAADAVIKAGVGPDGKPRKPGK